MSSYSHRVLPQAENPPGAPTSSKPEQCGAGNCCGGGYPDQNPNSSAAVGSVRDPTPTAPPTQRPRGACDAANSPTNSAAPAPPTCSTFAKVPISEFLISNSTSDIRRCNMPVSRPLTISTTALGTHAGKHSAAVGSVRDPTPTAPPTQRPRGACDAANSPTNSAAPTQRPHQPSERARMNFFFRYRVPT